MKTIGDGEFDMLFFVINFVGCKRFERNSFFIKKNGIKKVKLSATKVKNDDISKLPPVSNGPLPRILPPLS